MPSPVTETDLPALTSTASICDRFSQLINVREQFSEFLGWLIGSDGELSDEALDGIADRTTPVGTILLYASASPPSSKFLMCNGAAVSRATYSDLFSRIGTTYGAGDSVTTFNLPDLRDRFPTGQGSTYALGATGGAAQVSLLTANIADHFHGYAVKSLSEPNDANFTERNWSLASNGTTASFFIPGDASITGSATAITSGELATTIQIDGASGTVTPHENRPPYCAVQFIIKAL